GAELMLAASLYSKGEGERQVLFEHLDRLSSSDLLLLDRGYIATWLVAVLIHRNIPFCMRVDKNISGWTCVRDFMKSGLHEGIVALPAVPDQDAHDYECPSHLVQVRLVRHTVPGGKTRILMTNLMDTQNFPADVFGDLYHQRWRVEEAFKRLKHRLSLEHVSGLSQQAVMQDVAAKILCDNLQSLVCSAASKLQNLPADRRILRTYAYSALHHLIPAVLLAARTYHTLQIVMATLVKRTQKHRPGVSKHRNPSATKPHKHMAFKPC
ncbi:MAG: transposase, partial [Pseudomonadales bacterium]|nr:transposase [Pseudomonadales bacterium]